MEYSRAVLFVDCRAASREGGRLPTARDARRRGYSIGRIASPDGEHEDCDYHESWCGAKQQLRDELRFGLFGDQCVPGIPQPWPHDHLEDCVDDYFENQVPFIDYLDEALVTNREIGRSWGVNTEGNVCGPGDPSQIFCSEEGGLVCTDGGRQLRDRWRELEDEHLEDPTGYFIENDTADCRHCILTGAQLDCAAQYLEGGRESLSGSCLAWDDNPGQPAQNCIGYPQ